jgi:hypothetical protein
VTIEFTWLGEDALEASGVLNLLIYMINFAAKLGLAEINDSK